jgi:hypothetical protein
MNSNDFGGAVIPAMAGFFLFGKRAKVQEIQQDKPQQLPMVLKTDANGLTGVARYLILTPLVTGVAKYMKKKEKQPMTSVELYVLRQSIAEKNVPAPTSVSKYLAKVTKEAPTRKKTGVDKYVAKQEWAARSFSTLTGVAKYEAEQELCAKKQAAAAMIKRYLDEEEAGVISARAAAEAAYEASRNMIYQENTEVEVVEEPATTRVGRYLQEQAALSKKRPAVTGVGRYLAKQIALDSQKPTISGVSRYLREQAVVLSKKPNPTGVARYLSNQLSAPAFTPKVTLAQSGVARYLASQTVIESSKPSLSGVAKYMERQAQLDKDKVSLIGQGNLLKYEATHVEAEKCLEGEFIPANDFLSATGVSRYLEKQGDVVTVAKEVAKESITGVSRYLEKQVGSVKQSLSPAPTSVDRYLLNRA